MWFEQYTTHVFGLILYNIILITLLDSGVLLSMGKCMVVARVFGRAPMTT